MTKVDDINRELRMLWKETIDSGSWPLQLRKLWPHQHGEVDGTAPLLFIGMNPAYAKRDDKVRKETDIVDTDILFREDGVADLCESTEFPDAPYFRALDCFAREVGIEHREHVDIFAVREADQAKVRDALELPNKLTTFAQRQFGLFEALLSRMNPEVIVVVNSGASHVLSHMLSLGSMYEDHCCHFLEINGRSVPIFLSGMIYGQRAMDVYSKQRLAYLVRRMMQ